MKSYEIVDEELSLSIGVLLWYEGEDSVTIILNDKLNEWNCPLIFTALVQRGVFTVSRELSRMWVRARVIPSGRQNIGSILTTHRLKEYNEMKLLILAEGRCSQDSMYIRPVSELPSYALKSMAYQMKDCVLLGGNSVLCLFVNGEIKKAALSEFPDRSTVDKILHNEALFQSGRIAPGGLAVTFNNSIDIPSETLYKIGKPVGLTSDDLLSLMNNLMDTSKVCELLECSRQNLAYLSSQGTLTPVKHNVKGNLYLKGDVLRTRW